jgi:Na+/H+ antiporter NhaD/arsenite permease-like protein
MRAWIGCFLLGWTGLARAAASGPAVAGVPLEFLFFAAVLGLVAFSHLSTMRIALWGALGITLYKVLIAGFAEGAGIGGLLAHLGHEWVALSNLLALLVGFSLLAQHFEKSQLPAVLPHYLPDGWGGPLVLLWVVFVLSSFLDNIAAAMIGGAIAHTVFRARVHIGYLAAIVAASNAGGAGSVVGDTTTTMMWLAGISPAQVFHAYVAAVVALLVCSIPAARQQHRYSPIMQDAPPGVHIDWARVAIVALMLVAAIGANLLLNWKLKAWIDAFPFLGATVWIVIVATSGWRRPQWPVVPSALRGAAFLLSLVWSASLMPVEALPGASWHSALALGFVSAVFDNIPLTALALKQGGFDWGFLAYAVGFGGSMLWFGSSAGVALAQVYPEARSAVLWLRCGWHVVLGYVLGFMALLALLGWQAA